GAAAVAGLCAHVRLDEPGDRALGVVDGGVQAEHLAVGEAGGAAHPEHLLADGGLGGLADPDRLAADVDVAGRLGRRVVVLDEREVALAGEDGLVDGGDRRAALLVGPLVAAERAVTGRQEGRGAVARGDVEAQGAAGVGGEDGVTAGHEGPEGAGGLLDGGHAGAEALDGGFQAVPLVAGDGAVRGDQDLVGARVDRPGGAGDAGLGLQGLRPGLQLAHAVVDLAHGRARPLGLHDHLVVVSLDDVDDELLLVAVVVGTGEAVTEEPGELRGEVRGVRRLQCLRRRCRLVRRAVLRGVGVREQQRGSAERHDAARRYRGLALRNSLVTQTSRPPGGGPGSGRRSAAGGRRDGRWYARTGWGVQSRAGTFS